MPEVKLVPLEQIPWEECFAFQCRNQMSEEHTKQLFELVSESDEEAQQTGAPLKLDLFPPLIVFTKGGISDLFYLADGFHRYEALERAGRDAWPCEVHVVEDPLFSAMEHSLIANTTHGLRRDAETCRRVFEKARKQFPDLKMYGKDGIEGKTGLSRGFLYIHLKRLKDAGTPDNHVTQTRTNPNNPAPKADSLRAERADAKCNPNYEPAPALEDEPETEDIVEAQKPKGKMVDKLGRQIAPGLRPKFNSSAVAELVRKCGMLVADLDALAGEPGWEYLDVAANGRSIKSVQASIKAAEYYTECPRCDCDKACKLCKGAGFITSLQFARLDDREKAGLKD
jgi:hypothetical protein